MTATVMDLAGISVADMNAEVRTALPDRTGVEKDGSPLACSLNPAAAPHPGKVAGDRVAAAGRGRATHPGNALFVAAETALVTVERTEVDAAAAARNARARRLRGALSRLSTQLSAAQLGITVTSLATGLVAEPSIATLLHGPLTATGLPESAVEPIAVAVGLLLASVVQMVLGELVPKNLALARPLATASAVLPLQLGFATASRPLVAVLNGTANRLLRTVGVEPTEELRSARTPDELSLVLRQSAARVRWPPRPRGCWSAR
jgi:Cyclin M transmembrane N-terminal domain